MKVSIAYFTDFLNRNYLLKNKYNLLINDLIYFFFYFFPLFIRFVLIINLFVFLGLIILLDFNFELINLDENCEIRF